MASASVPGMDVVGELAAQLRVDSIRCSTSAGSGHPTSSMSAADLLAVLVTRHLRYDWNDPEAPGNDHLIFSKGHASPLLYSVFKAVGVVSDEELIGGYRRFGQRLQGHPTPVLPWVDVATGSLGQGLPDGVGIALAGKHLDRQPYRVWVLCGDSELAEGSMWEALDKASHYELSNLIAIVDVNRLGQRGPTELQWDMDAYARRVESFGARAVVVDGHDLSAIDAAMAAAAAAREGKPTVILAKTIKGRGFWEVEDKLGWHGKTFPADMAERAVAELGGVRCLQVTSLSPPVKTAGESVEAEAAEVVAPRYAVGDVVATRKAYGDALVLVGARDPLVVALDGEVGNSTHMDAFAKAYPERFFEMFIAEQQLVAAATGLRSSEHDQVTLVGAGVTVHGCLQAADALEHDGISARVIDCYSVKPIDTATLTAAVRDTGGRVVIVEDHHPEGGLGSAVTAALLETRVSDLHVSHLAVRDMPGSGSGQELMAWAGIDADHIAAAARGLVTTDQPLADSAAAS